jgi:hypothetical protein
MTSPALEATLQRRTRLLAGAVLLLTLVAGFGLGWGFGHRPRGMHGAFGRGTPGREMPREGRPGQPGRTFAKRLNLTETQQKQVDSIFATTRADVAAFWDGPGARLKSIIDSTGIKVRSVLDSAQKVEFDKIEKGRARGGDGRGPWDGRGRGDHGPGPGMPAPGGPPVEGAPPPPR